MKFTRNKTLFGSPKQPLTNIQLFVCLFWCSFVACAACCHCSFNCIHCSIYVPLPVHAQYLYAWPGTTFPSWHCQYSNDCLNILYSALLAERESNDTVS